MQNRAVKFHVLVGIQHMLSHRGNQSSRYLDLEGQPVSSIYPRRIGDLYRLLFMIRSVRLDICQSKFHPQKNRYRLRTKPVLVLHRLHVAGRGRDYSRLDLKTIENKQAAYAVVLPGGSSWPSHYCAAERATCQTV